jgi:hypothetical protein
MGCHRLSAPQLYRERKRENACGLISRTVVESDGGFLQRPGSPCLQFALPQFGKFSPLLPLQGRGIPQLVILRPLETLIALRLQHLVFARSQSIHRFAQMLGNIKFVEYDLFLRFA